MSKGGTLKIKGLFKIKSPEKESTEPKLSGSLKDGAGTNPRDQTRTLPTSTGHVSPGDNASLADDALKVSTKAKKLRLPFLKRKKPKRRDSERGGGDLFFLENDELDSFSSHR